MLPAVMNIADYCYIVYFAVMPIFYQNNEDIRKQK